MTSVSDVLVVVQVATGPLRALVLNSTLADATQSGGTVVLQVTRAPGVEPPTLAAFTVTVETENLATGHVKIKQINDTQQHGHFNGYTGT